MLSPIGFDIGKKMDQELRDRLIGEVRCEIEDVTYTTRLNTIVVCLLLLKNGFTAEGRTVSSGNEDQDRKAAWIAAVNIIISAKMYAHMEKLHQEQLREYGRIL